MTLFPIGKRLFLLSNATATFSGWHKKLERSYKVLFEVILLDSYFIVSSNTKETGLGVLQSNNPTYSILLHNPHVSEDLFLLHIFF